ncbi:MAG TPA: prepilin-type N-terminal cleavage/methylation domain-containing protein [Planctomycetes bacterium]|nr:prepilin-type N-terminal cleavage/methylation domain-containing protein [Planctomycetota bacterium]
MSPSRDRRGFTLIEVLLTLLIMTGIMVTITQVLTGARRTRDEVHNIQERQLAGPAILDQLERDLRGMFVYDRDPHDLLRIRDRVLSGFDADTIDFVTTTDGLLPWQDNPSEPFRAGDWNEVGYRLRPRPDSDEFLEIYRREGFGVDDRPFDQGRYALLSDRVKGFNIEVYEEDGPDTDPTEAWDGEEGGADSEFVGIPARIEVFLTIEMAPRLAREQLIIDRRTLTYSRIIRFPAYLRKTIDTAPIPAIPVLTPPVAYVPGGGSDAGGGGGGGGLLAPEDPNAPAGGEGGGDGGGDDNPFGGAGSSGGTDDLFGGGSSR